VDVHETGQQEPAGEVDRIAGISVERWLDRYDPAISDTNIPERAGLAEAGAT
jgi:hypothetical protein